ncbi:MAG: hypothetical protein ABS81_14210 [Pseudonocardia sp. SCN 72-86]|nr:MAG: hypothetical protein ABS81_14210 [Pseudonocardia sp. SCN 72-86]
MLTSWRRARAARTQGISPDAFAQLTAPVAGRLRAAAVLQAVASATLLGPCVGIWLLAREVLAGGHRVWPWVTIVAASAVGGFLLRLAAYALSHDADVAVARDVRLRVAEHLGRVPLGWFTAGGASRTALSALRGDVEDLHAAVAHGRLDVVGAVVGPLLAVCWLLVVDWRLALLLVAMPVLSTLLLTRALSGATDVMRAVPAAIAGLTGAVARMVRDIATLRVTGRRADEPVLHAVDGLHTALERAVRLQEVRGGRANALVAPVLTLTLVLAAGTGMIALGTLAPVDLLPFLLFAVSVSALARIPETMLALRTGHAAATRLATLLELPTLPVPAAPRPTDGARVEFRDVTFGHHPQRPVLHGIDLLLEPGTTTALVGPSGAGKSTLAALVGRFWDVTSGAVLVGGTDVREASDLYRAVGFVLQDSALPRTSLRDAIRLARPTAPDAEVEAAARAAGIHDRIAELPDGYDTVAGEDIRLSGGERQRIAIARLLLADPDVVVLDEATAHLDPESEAQVLAALARLTAGRTVLVVAHRLATVTGADTICVLDRGRIVQRGAHADLLREPGVYRDLWEAHEGVSA